MGRGGWKGKPPSLHRSLLGRGEGLGRRSEEESRRSPRARWCVQPFICVTIFEADNPCSLLLSAAEDTYYLLKQPHKSFKTQRKYIIKAYEFVLTSPKLAAAPKLTVIAFFAMQGRLQVHRVRRGGSDPQVLQGHSEGFCLGHQRVLKEEGVGSKVEEGSTEGQGGEGSQISASLDRGRFGATARARVGRTFHTVCP